MAWINSLQSRLLLVMALVFALGAGNVTIYFLDLIEDLKDHLLKEQVDTILAASNLASDGSNLASLPTTFSESDWRYSLYTRSGRLIGTTPAGSLPLPFQPPGSVLRDAPSVMTVRTIADDRVLVLERKDWADCGALCQIFRERVATPAAVAAALGVVSVISILMLVRWMLASVHRAADLASTIGVEHPERRIPLEDLPKEIRPLAISANQALDRLAEAYSVERRFTADAAHALRTPLTVLDLRIQKASTEQNPDWTAISSDMEQIRHLIDQLLALARADRGEKLERDTSRIALARVIREAIADILPAYEASGRAISADIIEGMLVSDGGRQLHQALQNLLENAIHHGQGQVTVRLTRKDERTAIVRVADEGPGVSPEEADVLFNRFHKGAQNSSGSGLGLAIVRRTLRNLGGDAKIPRGSHFAVELTVPLSLRTPARQRDRAGL